MEIAAAIIFLIVLLGLLFAMDGLKQSIKKDESRPGTIASRIKYPKTAPMPKENRILCKTKGNASPKGKPRVYFTCHPDDVAKYFDKISGDIFRTHDCAIFYTEDMRMAIPEEAKPTDLESNNLFVIPVTLKLLTTPNRAMDVDIPFALSKHIPVLPFMMEPGIDTLYSRPDKFGELQYLRPYNTDPTAISYEEKLKKYLSSVLLGDETAKRIRTAFDAYIFLSYRKKDRVHANALMRLIHSYPECRDIAIWYDEFLTPGESFRENIEKILSNSQLFTLLVTPSLLEKPDGKPNFVMAQEYPAARQSGIDILPVEMQATNRATLAKNYRGIPACADPTDTEAFKLRLLESIARIATAASEDPMHNFLIGLAYMEGIDVEVNRGRGLELIAAAANAELPEAMEKLYYMYLDGVGVPVDYRESANWAQRLITYYQQHSEEHRDTALWQSNLAEVCCLMGNYSQSIDLYETVYAFSCKTLGAEHPNTITSLFNLAVNHNALGNYQKAQEIFEKVYTLRCRIWGEEHPETLISLNGLAIAFSNLGDYAQASKLQEKAYTLCCATLGEEHPETIMLLHNLAYSHFRLGSARQALPLQERVYAQLCKNMGKEHPNTLTAMCNLAGTYSQLGEYQRALELNETVYTLRCKLLGQEHPDTLAALNNLAASYKDLGDHQKVLEFSEKVYLLSRKILGEEHPDTLTSLGNLASAYVAVGAPAQALPLHQTAYTLRCKILGQEHPDTLTSLGNLASTHCAAGNFPQALECAQQAYTCQCRILGQEHPDTILSLSNLAFIYSGMGQQEESLQLQEEAYALHVKVMGKEHPSSLTVLRNLAFTYAEVGQHRKALQWQEKAYDLHVKVMGEEYPPTITLLCNQAILQLWLGNHSEALQLFEKGYQLRKKVLGDAHPDTQESLNNLIAAREQIANT